MASEHLPDELFQLTRIIEHLHPGQASDAADLAFAIDKLIAQRLSHVLKGFDNKPGEKQ